MGILSSFNIKQLQDNFNLKQYVETGLGIGECLKTAIQAPFEKLFSAELDPEFVQNLKYLEEDKRVKLVQGKSTEALKEILPQLSKDPTLFWLDAHLPFGDFRKISYEESVRTYLQDCFPLKEEIEIIKSLRDCSKDVFIIDDLLLYEEGFQCEHLSSSGDFQHRELARSLGVSLESSFLYNILQQTHQYTVDRRHQGYFILIPL